MTERRHRVLVVDDSAFARKVLREVLSADARFEVVGFARDGLDALEKIDALRPDVITLDLVMPELDGVGVLRVLAERADAPRVVIVTMSDADSLLGVAALESGAFDVVHKPTALATDMLYELDKELVEKVALAARSPALRIRAPLAPPAPDLVRPTRMRTQLLAIGASTGGPRAVASILAALPEGFPAPVAVVVHMPPGYTESFAARLDATSKLHVVEAVDGMPLEAGIVVIARAGMHLRVRRDSGLLVASVVREPRVPPVSHCPSVDALFESAAATLGGAALGVVLTGMGADGLVGARAIHAAGGQLLTESEATSVVYGMPRVVQEAGLGAAEFPLDRLPSAIFDRL